ncbi:MAG: hypothetical protein ABSH50_07770 [Bryobacteraceae bacterium]|jgi:hypothetical protein
MSREDIQKLIGGYATGALSPAEQRALLEAALEDQDLFDALAKEQGLRDALQDPAARQQLLAALEPPRRWTWLRRPATLALAGALAMLLIVAGVVFLRPKPAVRPETIVADVTAPRVPVPLPEAAQAPVKRPALAKRAVRSNLTAATETTQAEVQPVPPPAAIPPAPSVEQSAAPAPTPTPAPALAARRLPAMGAFGRAKVAAASSTSPVLEYQVLLANPDGGYALAPVGTVLHAGDSVRLQVEPPAAGNLLLFQRGAAGGMNLVASEAVAKAQQYILPASGGLQSDKPGTIELMLMLMPQDQSAVRFQNNDGTTLGQPVTGQVQKVTLEFH